MSGFQLFKIGKGYLDGRSEYDKVRKLAVTDDKNKNNKEKNNSEFSQFMSQYSKNNAIIYERGLFSVLLDKELDENSSLKFNSLLARKGEKE